MHPRNRYREGTNFLLLAEKYPALKHHLLYPANSPSQATIDFKNESAQRCLTEALLQCDFGLKLQLPTDRLCPPVPNRLNYVLWIQDIVEALKGLDGVNEHDVVRGIDIGTGASAIYPLLSCREDEMWYFVASEIDPISFRYAQNNVSSNKLDSRIKIIKASGDDPLLLPLSIDPHQRHTFSMCNPPFYSSAEDVARSAEAKHYGPNAVCTGAEIEMITEGGEVAFVGRMVEESLGFRDQCRWYTSMLGKLSSVSDIVELLRKHEIDNYAITEFVQGQTRRWAVGWSFTDFRLPDSISRISNPVLQRFMPTRNNVQQPVNAPSLSILADSLLSVLSSIIDIRVERKVRVGEQSDAGSYFLVMATQDTWTRSARRRRLREQRDVSMVGINEKSFVALACAVHVSAPLVSRDTGRIVGTEDVAIVTRGLGEFTLEFQWKKGSDRSLFESFCSHVSSKILHKE